MAKVDPEKFQKTADEVAAKAREAIGNLYATRRASDGDLVEMVRTVWSFTYHLSFLQHSPRLLPASVSEGRAAQELSSRARRRSFGGTGSAMPTCPWRQSHEIPKGGSSSRPYRILICT